MRILPLCLLAATALVGSNTVRSTIHVAASSAQPQALMQSHRGPGPFTFSHASLTSYLGDWRQVTAVSGLSPLRMNPYVEMFGPTSVTTAGDYHFTACSRGFTNGIIKISWWEVFGPGAGTNYAVVNGQDTCTGVTLSYSYGHPTFAWAVFGRHCAQLDEDSHTCDASATLGDGSGVLNNIPQPFAISFSGPATRPTGVAGTWISSVLPGPSVGPYTYEWSGVLSGNGTSITGTIAEPGGFLTLTVTDANGLQRSTSTWIYVCEDVC